MTSKELRKQYIDFFVSKGHKEIKSASLIPDNDASVLFTTAGMHPLVPYLLGEKHPAGTRLVNHQKCLRTGDIDEVGDDSHLTFFEMMGNWSLGDYFKKESISMSHEFLTKVLGISQEKISVTVFGGDDTVPRDEESYGIWKSLGYPESRIFFLGKKENWWGPVGEQGPCGPDTEIFVDTGKQKCSPECNPSCSCGKYMEIWNNVFMEYYKTLEGSFQKMDRQNVDTGLGLERVLMYMNGKSSVFETDLFAPIIEIIEKCSGNKCNNSNRKAFRIIADHMRAAAFILGDEKAVAPSNVDQGYVLRRIIRRAIRYLGKLGADAGTPGIIADVIVSYYSDVYPELQKNKSFIISSLDAEEKLFSKTLEQGVKMAEKYLSELKDGEKLSGEKAFRLYDTFGFHIEFTKEIAHDRGVGVDEDGFAEKFSEHQEKSRAGAENKFKGGLSDNSERTTRLHTATHLLLSALRKVLGTGVSQKGSNITPERLRFDFSFDRKMEDNEITEVEKLVNEAIAADVPIVCREMSMKEAKDSGAIGIYEASDDETVKVYTADGYSMEICGGPHASRTGELKRFKIQKEQSSSAGVRRIKAVIEDQ